MCETNAYMPYTDNTIWRDFTRTWTSEASYRLSEALTRYGQAKMKQASRRRLCGRQLRINADISGGRETTLRQFNPPTWASDAGSSGNPCGMAPPCPRGHALSLASEGQAPDPKSFLGVKQYCCGSRAHHSLTFRRDQSQQEAPRPRGTTCEHCKAASYKQGRCAPSA